MANRKYHTLLSIDGSPGCPWAIEFGDYDIDTVKDEWAEMRDRGWKAKELKIITTGDAQADIEAAVAALNKDL
ncbi:hypothetical protein CN074_25185 [Sinorhizobium medicae]|uniref:hypothetical protein n=1 Tax=Sinorhizobium medicae TaxID=110321 RepID=UPI000FDCB86B|nr:hypothetical protein [Sinorhizobium medicae]RVH82708.1 hypothetical protein CN201_28920 [Sinorhizobium medicae]RVP63890.1 hypothetical protein CN074_25185 [Sinorhizobium medicae]